MFKANSKITYIVIAAVIVLVFPILELYNFDTDPGSIVPLKHFMENENERFFNNDEWLTEITEECDSVSSLLNSYDVYKVNADMVWYVLNLVDGYSYHCDASGWEYEYKELIPNTALTANTYIEQFIKVNALWDCMMALDPEDDDYWQAKYLILSEIRLHEPYLKNNFYGYLYKYMPEIAMILVGVEILCVAYLLVTFVIYVIAGLKASKVKGME